MEYAKNQKYFKKKNLIPTLIFAGIAVVGFIFMCLFGFRFRSPKTIASLLVMLLGIVGVIATLTSGMKDDDIDAAVASVTNKIEARAAEVFKFPRRYETIHPQITLGGFDFTREGTEYKRGKDLKYRCKYYCGLLLSFTDDGLRVLSQKFSILEDDMKEDILYFKWEDVESASHVEKNDTLTMLDGKQEPVPYIIFTLKMRDGTTYDYCIRNTADVDEAEDIIRRQFLKVEQGKLRVRQEN